MGAVKNCAWDEDCVTKSRQIKLSQVEAVVFRAWESMNRFYAGRLAPLLHCHRQGFVNTGVCFWPVPLVSYFWAFIGRLFGELQIHVNLRPVPCQPPVASNVASQYGSNLTGERRSTSPQKKRLFTMQ
jgi:hypothetical protein